MAKLIFRLKGARRMKGLSLSEASKKLGKSRYWLNKFENGGFPMDSTTLIMFARFYGVPVDYLVPDKNRKDIELKDVHFCKMPNYV